MAVTYMTEEGLRKLKEELIELKSVQAEISRQIAEARTKICRRMQSMMPRRRHKYVGGQDCTVETLIASQAH